MIKDVIILSEGASLVPLGVETEAHIREVLIKYLHCSFRSSFLHTKGLAGASVNIADDIANSNIDTHLLQLKKRGNKLRLRVKHSDVRESANVGDRVVSVSGRGLRGGTGGFEGDMYFGT